MDLSNLSVFLNQEAIKYLINVDLSEYTHTLTGGTVPIMIYPQDEVQLVNVVKNLKNLNVEYVVLSGMTNIVVASGRLKFVVLNMSEYSVRDPKLIGNKLNVSASYEMKALTKWTLTHKVNGLEWMEGIFGTVGAGVYMNAGFLSGQDMEHFLIDVRYLDLNDFEVKTMKNQDMKFRYRYSIFQDMNAIILEANFLVRPIRDMKYSVLRSLRSKHKVKKYHKRRADNQPLELPSAGTVFVPPIPYHVGGLLREMKLVGHTIGGAQISTKSPGFIVGVDEMTGEDYAAMVMFIQTEVQKKYGLNLIPEVRLMGFEETNGNHFG